MQVPILSGAYTDENLGIRTAYPINMTPIASAHGISAGYMRPADGIVSDGAGPDIGRGGINWNGALYRVFGSKLCSVSSGGAVTVLGDVGTNTLPVSMDYSFDRLAIASNGNLFYWDGATLTQVTDPDLGVALDALWIDGYFMTTDGENLVVTELNDPTQVNPLKYGSSELDPDPVKALKKLRNEVYAVNRYTIEVFDNVGGEYFPFQRIDGAQIPKGAVGTHACTVYMESVAFLGSGRNEQPSIYMGSAGRAQKIATREIDDILEQYTETQLADAVLECRNDRGSELLYVHLPDRTLVFDAVASQSLNSAVWFILTSSVQTYSKYRARHFVYVYDKWTCSDPTTSSIGHMTDTLGTHYGQTVRWEFGTQILYNESNGAIFNELELVALPGRIDAGLSPTISTSYSVDGVTWSQDRAISVGNIGDRTKRLVWRRQGFMRNWRIQRFRGDSSSYLSFARLEAQLEPLAR